jgi:hypothetical protein
MPKKIFIHQLDSALIFQQISYGSTAHAVQILSTDGIYERHEGNSSQDWWKVGFNTNLLVS